MKPKERKNQTQKSRLYCRGNDHRDILWYDEDVSKMKYHYGLYWNEEDDQQVDEEHLAWVKFPNKSLLYYNYPVFAWIDVDRQFQYALQIGGGQRTGRMFKQNNGIVWLFDTYSGMGTAYCIASDNGVVWHDITSKFSYVPNYQGAFPMGEDSIAWTWGDDYWHGGGTKAHIDWVRITKDDDGEFQVEQQSYTLDCDESWLYWGMTGIPVGTINDKLIVVKEVSDYYNQSQQQWFFSISRNGHVEMLSDPVPQPSYMRYFNGKMTCAQQGVGDGARLFMVTAGEVSYDAYRSWVSQVVAWSSMDGGRTWNKEVLFGGNTLPDYDSQHGGIQHRIEIFNRDGEIFILFGQACDKDGSGYHEVHLYSTLTGTSWNEIPLPKWVELPVINEPSGRGIDPSSKEKIKVAIRPEETSGQDHDMFDLLMSGNRTYDFTRYSMDFAHGNTMWQDGELKPLKDTDFYMVIGYSPMLYFDNRYMAESTKAFAWYVASIDTTIDGADYVIPYDYCAPGAVTVEMEESNE